MARTIKSVKLKQKKELVRFIVAAAESAAKRAVAQTDLLNKDGAQLVIVHGDKFKAGIERAIIKALKSVGKSTVLAKTKHSRHEFCPDRRREEGCPVLSSGNVSYNV